MKILENKAGILVGLIVLILFFVGYNLKIQYRQTGKNSSVQQISPASQTNSFSYKGKTGIDALTLLKNKAKVSMDKSGMVANINGRQSYSSGHEYWAFYINGKLANVGPADYVTKDNDSLSWKIEKY